MIYQQPLAYLLGVEGEALLRAWAGDYDEEFVRARLAEVRQLLDEPLLAGHPGVSVARGTSEVGYRQYSDSYDEPRNGLFDIDEPFVHQILDGLPAGVALDAACGTGRFADYLAEKGHQVIGVDSSPDMLTVARRRVPSAEFLLGELDRLPVGDNAVAIVTCALALAHMPELGPAIAEFARVLRPGGHLIISDVDNSLILRGVIVPALGPSGEPGLVRTFRHSTGDYVRAALATGLVIRRFEEPSLNDQNSERYPAPERGKMEPGPWENWPWTLMWLIPDVIEALTDPIAVLWHFQMPD